MYYNILYIYIYIYVVTYIQILYILTKYLQLPGTKCFIESGNQPAKVRSTGN